MENQTVMDLLALTMPDVQLLDAFEMNRTYFEDGYGAQHEVIMHMIVEAIDNTYGIGSFDMYKNTGILPSQQ